MWLPDADGENTHRRMVGAVLGHGEGEEREVREDIADEDPGAAGNVQLLGADPAGAERQLQGKPKSFGPGSFSSGAMEKDSECPGDAWMW